LGNQKGASQDRNPVLFACVFFHQIYKLKAENGAHSNEKRTFSVASEAKLR